jgi:hypothetical protein
VVGRSVNRRRHERFSLPPMYSAVTVNTLTPGTGEPKLHCAYDGHCYDISEGGVQFELDEELPYGTPVELNIELPTQAGEPVRPVKVYANVVWTDTSEPGPVRMAAVFSRFAQSEDKERLFKQIISGRLARAA